MLDVGDLVLDFVLYWNVLPCRKENTFVHFAIFRKQDVHWNAAAEVEHVDVVLDSHLHITHTQKNAIHGSGVNSP